MSPTSSRSSAPMKRAGSMGLCFALTEGNILALSEKIENNSCLYVHGLGHFHPPHIIDNAFISSLDIGSDENWILERVGIRSRRTVLSLDYIRETKNARPLDAAAAS